MADDLALLAAGLLPGLNPHCKRSLTFVRDVFRCGGRAVGGFEVDPAAAWSIWMRKTTRFDA